MDGVRVLFVSEHADEGFEREIRAAGYEFSAVPFSLPPRDIAVRDDYELLVVKLPLSRERVDSLFQTVRTHLLGAPLQIIAIAATEEDYRFAIESGADDVILDRASDVELIARLRAADFRLEAQRRTYREREVFRRAVRDEESVNARILDRNRILADACRSLENMRRELERSNERLREIARFDTLSGLLNRTTLFATMDMEIERAVRSGGILSGFMTDLDHFKRINDDWGHLSGDEVIRTVGVRMNRILRKYDYAGRYGGEEFFVVLPNADLEGAASIAERFRTALVCQPVDIGGESLKVTASIGVAEFRPGEVRDAWIARADEAMYQAKQQGRDRVCLVS